MKKTTSYLLALMVLVVFSCKEDDTRSCTTCSSDQTPPFEVCEDGNGNASVNGEGTGVRYDIYIADLVAAGAECGG